MILGLSRRDGRRSSGSTRSPLNELLATGVPLLLRPAIAESGFAALGAARSSGIGAVGVGHRDLTACPTLRARRL